MKELCIKANVSRQTFYSLFRSKENIITYNLEKNYIPLPKTNCEKQTHSLKDICHYYAMYVIQNYNFLELIVENGLISLLFQSLHKSILNSTNMIEQKSEKDHYYIASFVASALASITKSFILQKEERHGNRFEEITIAMFNGEFFKA